MNMPSNTVDFYRHCRNGNLPEIIDILTNYNHDMTTTKKKEWIYSRM